MTEHAQELQNLRTIMLEAGVDLLAERGRLRDIDYKSATDMVTDLDRRTEAFLVDRLRKLFPDDAIHAEEGTRDTGRSGRTWIIDPLDGTTNYVHGHPAFAISIGCAGPDHLLTGAVYAPALDELFCAARGQGATLEKPAAGTRRPLQVSTATDLQHALLATGFPYKRDDLVDLNSALVRTFLKMNCHGVRRCGSAAVDLCFVAAGRLDGYWEFKLNPWDVAAGAIIAAEAGAVVTDLTGQGHLFDGRSIVAAVPALHPLLMKIILNELTPEHSYHDFLKGLDSHD
jgi:myo-inositol-1(or 4)-monophosphatase